MTKSADGGEGGYGALKYEGEPPAPESEANTPSEEEKKDPDHPVEHHRRWIEAQALVFQPAMADVLLDLLRRPEFRNELRFAPASAAHELYEIQRRYRGRPIHSGALFDREVA